jgi:sialate O-acetylesterase
MLPLRRADNSQVHEWKRGARLAGLLFLSLVNAAMAEVRLAGVFTDGMVLQRGKLAPIWGSAEAGESIEVEFAGQRQSCITGADGLWRVLLDPLEASIEGRQLTVSGRSSAVINDVVVGEVWLCSGQSNMAMALAEADGGLEVMSHADPLLRAFRVPERPGERPWTSVNGKWTRFIPGPSSEWAATPYFFGQRLRRELGVPIGLVVCAWGGSSAISWMSPQALNAFGPLLPEEVIGWGSNIQPSRLYHGMLFPLVPYAFAGVVWYQGETEADPAQNPFLYRLLFPALIEDWRALWNWPDMPFYWVQLPTLRDKPLWPIVRESQAAALRLPFTGMIPTIDIGQEARLHPTNKRAFGERLADLVLGLSYGRESWAGAPTFRGLERDESGSIRLLLENAEGLKTTDGAKPAAFELAGKGGDFAQADARIDGQAIVLSSGDLQEPVEVRYAWHGNPKVNVVNQAGLPLAPFRTDSRPMAGEEWHWQELPRKEQLSTRATGLELSEEAAPGWSLKLDGIDRNSAVDFNMVRAFANACQLACSGRLRKPMTLASPRIFWETNPRNFDGSHLRQGLTVEVQVQMYRATDPFRGFDIDVVLPDANNRLRRYLVSILPMRIYAHHGAEIRLLASNLDNATEGRSYRIAIRGDGVAQVFYNGAPVGMVLGQIVEGEGSPYLRIGKQTDVGSLTANLYEASFDGTGAFAPKGE